MPAKSAISDSLLYESKKKNKKNKVRSKVRCPPVPIPPMFDSQTQQFYKITPKGKIQSSKSLSGSYRKVTLETLNGRVNDELFNKLKSYSTVCESGVLTDVLTGQIGSNDKFIRLGPNGQDWYAMSETGKPLVLKPGHKKWRSVKRAPAEILKWSIDVQASIEKQKIEVEKKAWDKKLNYFLSQNKEYVAIKDLKTNNDEDYDFKLIDDFNDLAADKRTELLNNLWFNQADWKMYTQSPKTGKLLSVRLGRASKMIKRIYGMVQAQFWLAGWEVETGDTRKDPKAQVVPESPWVGVKPGPFCKDIYYNDFSQNGDFSKPSSSAKKKIGGLEAVVDALKTDCEDSRNNGPGGGGGAPVAPAVPGMSIGRAARSNPTFGERIGVVDLTPNDQKEVTRMSEGLVELINVPIELSGVQGAIDGDIAESIDLLAGLSADRGKLGTNEAMTFVRLVQKAIDRLNSLEIRPDEREQLATFQYRLNNL